MNIHHIHPPALQLAQANVAISVAFYCNARSVLFRTRSLFLGRQFVETSLKYYVAAS